MSTLSGPLFSLRDFLNGQWPAFLPPVGDIEVMEKLYLTPLVTMVEGEEAKLLTSVFFSQELILQVPGVDPEQAVVVLGGPGALTSLELTVHPTLKLRVVEAPLALRLQPGWLRAVRPAPEGVGYIPDHEAGVDLTISGAVVIDREGIEAEGVEFSTPLLMVGSTGVVLQLEECRLILTEPTSARLTELSHLGFEADFRGVYAQKARFHWLPQVVLNGSDLPGLNLTFEHAAIGAVAGELGVSGTLDFVWPVEFSDGEFSANTALKGYLFDPAWGIALADLKVELRRNSLESFLVQGRLRVPLLKTIFGVRFGAATDGKVTLEVSKAENDPREIDFLPGARLTLQKFRATGALGQNDLRGAGELSGTLELPGIGEIDLNLVQVRVEHTPAEDSLGLDIRDLTLGPLGEVENATLQVKSAIEAGTRESRLAMRVETQFAWQALRQRLNLGTLPEQFPLPPDDAAVKVSLHWQENGALVLGFAADLPEPDSLWQVMPPNFRPHVRETKFTWTATYASAADFQNASPSDSFEGEVAVEMEILLPDLPEVPGVQVFDQDTWFKASLKGGVGSRNTTEEAYLQLFIAPTLVLGVNLPGLDQAEPPIELGINRIYFSRTTSETDDATGHLGLDGTFRLRPINPAASSLPVPPAMAAHMEKLFQAARLKDFGGRATIDLKFKNDTAEMSLACLFDEEARMELDLFGMVSNLSRGLMASTGMEGRGNSIDLDIEVDIRLREIKLQFVSMEDSGGEKTFSFELGLDSTFAGVQVENFNFKLSQEQFSFGFGKLAVPLALPHFPLSLNDLKQLHDVNGRWDYQTIWLETIRKELTEAIKSLKDEIETLKNQENTAPEETLAALKAQLRQKRKELFDTSGRKFIIESIFAIQQLVGQPNRDTFQALTEGYVALMDATIHQIAFDTKLDFVLRDVAFVLPFHNPTDIRVEGGAHLAGFKPDDPLAPLGDLVFKLGLSAEFIFFSAEGGEPIPLPICGNHVNDAGVEEATVSVKLNEARIGYGYSKNSLLVALAGEVNIAKSLADDLNTADIAGIGLRLPERSRLGFKLDLIPIVLGEVDFLLPLFEFDLDLRKGFSPGISNSATCEPAWDGLQVIAPNLVRHGFKKLRLAPFFGSLLAPNYTLSFDLKLGEAHNGLTLVCDEYLVILSTSVYTIMPMLSDGTPFFNNLCANIQLAGFGIGFTLQRPFPSMSPLALFEIFGLLADPMMPIDPEGALANIVRVTIQNARLTLPPAVVRMFPEYGPELSREIHYTVNLGTFITLAQGIAGPVGQMARQLQEGTSDITGLLTEMKANLPKVSAAQVLALLPPELRRIDLEGSFGGFEASAAFLMLTPEEALKEFGRRDRPVKQETWRLVLEESFDNFPGWAFENPNLSGWEIFPKNRSGAQWRVERGSLRQTADIDFETRVMQTKEFEDMEFSAVLQSDSKNGIGVVFGYQDEENYYCFAMTPGKKRGELIKVYKGQGVALKEVQQDIQTGTGYTVTVRLKSTAPLPIFGRPSPGTQHGAVGQIRILVNGKEWLDYLDQKNPLVRGRIGFTCQANSGARFDSLRVWQYAPRRPNMGEYADPDWLRALQPNYAKPATPVFNPNLAANSLLKGEPFNAFAAESLAALPTPTAGASGVLVGAQVKVLDDQVYSFLGYLFTDGTFNLVSTMVIEPLRLAVAGLQVELPLAIHGRLTLSGRARGAESFSQVKAQGYGTWQPLPGVAELTMGSKTEPISLDLHSTGRFALKGKGGLKLFGGAASLDGAMDISQSHCLINGTLSCKPDFSIGNQQVFELSLGSEGRLGPGNAFELQGAGTMKILGKALSRVKGLVSEQGIAIEGFLEAGTWNWLGVEIKQLTMSLSGSINFSKNGPPDFLLQGDTSVRLFGTKTSKSRAEITGRGGIRAEGGGLTTHVEGSLFWQGREWLDGRLELGTDQISLKGRTALALDLTPDELPAGIKVAKLFFRIDLGGEFKLTGAGGLTDCALEVDWLLAVQMPGLEQHFPIAMQKKRFTYGAGESAPPAEIDLLPLVTIDSALFLPLETLNLPIPIVEADQETQFYWYWHDITPTTKPIYKKVTISSSGGTETPRFPTGIEQNQMLFSIPNPNPAGESFKVYNYKLGGWRYISSSDENLTLPTIKAPRVSDIVPGAIPASEKFALFKLPTHFAASFSEDLNMLKELEFSLALTWKNGKLGLTVRKGTSKKFKAFTDMFDDS